MQSELNILAFSDKCQKDCNGKQRITTRGSVSNMIDPFYQGEFGSMRLKKAKILEDDENTMG